MAFNLLKFISTIATLLAIFSLIYLRLMYRNEKKTKQMSKTAYILLVAFLLQLVSFTLFSIISFKNEHTWIAIGILFSAMSPYVLGRMIKDFEKVNYFIYLQIMIFIADLFLIAH